MKPLHEAKIYAQQQQIEYLQRRIKELEEEIKQLKLRLQKAEEE